jgi:hypothetical protein
MYHFWCLIHDGTAIQPGILLEQHGLSVAKLVLDRGMEERSGDGILVER